MKSPHTPFPWKARKDDNGWMEVYGPKPGPDAFSPRVCTLPYYRTKEERAIGEADARLISMIPEFLEALAMAQRVIEELDCPLDAPTEKIAALLARATKP